MLRRKDVYLEHLAAIPIFAGCTNAELQEIAQVATDLRFEPNHVIFHQGDTGYELLIIVEGSVRVERNGEVIARVDKGGVLGEMALLLHRPRSASAIADSAVDALVIDARSFGPLLDDVHGLAKKMLYTVVQRMDENAHHDEH